jgi:hypothetical protein
MMATELPATQAFEVVYASSYDATHPPSALSSNAASGAQLKTFEDAPAGWQSLPFCHFPQVLVMRFVNGPCRITQLHLLMHHYMYTVPRATIRLTRVGSRAASTFISDTRWGITATGTWTPYRRQTVAPLTYRD